MKKILAAILALALVIGHVVEQKAIERKVINKVMSTEVDSGALIILSREYTRESIVEWVRWIEKK